MLDRIVDIYRSTGRGLCETYASFPLQASPNYSGTVLKGEVNSLYHGNCAILQPNFRYC